MKRTSNISFSAVDNGLYPVTYSIVLITIARQQPGRKYRWGDENRRILGREKSQSAVDTEEARHRGSKMRMPR